ncbi:MAG: hypothetical protein J0M10_04810 [Chitinophagales bacterium]|nr:hypothetical protein [Chitinophagales bacterium]
MFPQKRHASLQPLSREHHQALLLCWKLRQGFSKAVEPERMKKYADWFWKNYLAPHFAVEEKTFFPLLDKEHPSVIKGLKDHQLLTKLFLSTGDVEYNLRSIAFELEQHIRFEERTLFNDIQEAATPEQLKALADAHKEEKFEENIEDRFWEEVKAEKPAPTDDIRELKHEKKAAPAGKKTWPGKQADERPAKREGAAQKDWKSKRPGTGTGPAKKETPQKQDWKSKNSGNRPELKSGTAKRDMRLIKKDTKGDNKK